MVMRRDENEAFVLRAPFKFEQAQHGLSIIRVATQTVAGFGRVGDEATALEVCGELSR
jgi:hypothetical protein